MSLHLAILTLKRPGKLFELFFRLSFYGLAWIPQFAFLCKGEKEATLFPSRHVRTPASYPQIPKLCIRLDNGTTTTAAGIIHYKCHHHGNDACELLMAWLLLLSSLFHLPTKFPSQQKMSLFANPAYFPSSLRELKLFEKMITRGNFLLLRDDDSTDKEKKSRRKRHHETRLVDRHFPREISPLTNHLKFSRSPLFVPLFDDEMR